MTAADLQVEFRRLRDHWRETGEGQYAVCNAYAAWFRQSCREGNPPDALRQNAGTEQERFFARTIPGIDGHTYWTSNRDLRFRLDGGGQRNARWWWFEHVNGIQERGTLAAVCGERNCITPEHQVFVHWSQVKRRYSDEQMIGALQAMAWRLGRTPTSVEWSDHNWKPSRDIIRQRFGSWTNAIERAGLKPVSYSRLNKYGSDSCLQALRVVAKEIGHTPTEDEFRAAACTLKEQRLPLSPHTIRARFGKWREATSKADLGTPGTPFPEDA